VSFLRHTHFACKKDKKSSGTHIVKRVHFSLRLNKQSADILVAVDGTPMKRRLIVLKEGSNYITDVIKMNPKIER